MQLTIIIDCNSRLLKGFSKDISLLCISLFLYVNDGQGNNQGHNMNNVAAISLRRVGSQTWGFLSVISDRKSFFVISGSNSNRTVYPRFAPIEREWAFCSEFSLAFLAVDFSKIHSEFILTLIQRLIIS